MTTTPTFIFKKNGEDNLFIIKAIMEFIQKNFHQKRNIRLEIYGSDDQYPCYKMLHKNDIYYGITDVFDTVHKKKNTLLQFTTGEHSLSLTNRQAIWMGEDSEVIVEDEKITIKRTGGPVVLTI